MRTINATLLTGQKILAGYPAFSLVIGSGANTVDLTSYLLAYEYTEAPAKPGALTLTLDNSASTFNTLPGDLANITQGAVVTFKRGLTISGTDYTEELPRTWVAAMTFDYHDSRSTYTIHCYDANAKLKHYRLASEQSWSDTDVETILAWILTQVGLTRLAGDMTDLSLDFAIKANERFSTALARLMDKLPEHLYYGLDAEIKWKTLDPAEASCYTLGWNAEHPVLDVSATGNHTWTVNTVTVNGDGSATGTAQDATQAAAVGTRRITTEDESLTTDAQCLQRATAELRHHTAHASKITIECRPIHGLEIWDRIKMDDPPWGGSDHTARVTGYKEIYDRNRARWKQTIFLGASTLPAGVQIDGSLIYPETVAGPNIAAHVITAYHIYANTITADELYASYIQVTGAAADVNANATTIDGGKITTNTIVANHITTNAITAIKINAGAVTATKINVSTLSAISANLGTITAGSITGVTATFGTHVTLDSSGITVTAGQSSTHQYKIQAGSTVIGKWLAYVDTGSHTGMELTGIAQDSGEPEMIITIGAYNYTEAKACTIALYSENRRVYVNNTLQTSDYMIALGGMHVGGTSDPGTDNLLVDGDIETTGGKLKVAHNTSSEMAVMTNDGNNADRWGLKIICGADNGSGVTNYLQAEDGDGDAIGNIRNNNGTFELIDLSDRSSKENIRDTQIVGLDIVNAIRIVDHAWPWDPNLTRQAGIIAQEAQRVFPDMVSQLDKEHLGISYSRLIPVLTKAVQELTQRLQHLEKGAS